IRHTGPRLPPSRVGRGGSHRIDRRGARPGNGALSRRDFWSSDVRGGRERGAPGNGRNNGDAGAWLYVSGRSPAISASDGLSRPLEESDDIRLPDRAVVDSDRQRRDQGPWIG